MCDEISFLSWWNTFFKFMCNLEFPCIVSLHAFRFYKQYVQQDSQKQILRNVLRRVLCTIVLSKLILNGQLIWRCMCVWLYILNYKYQLILRYSLFFKTLFILILWNKGFLVKRALTVSSFPCTVHISDVFLQHGMAQNTYT